MSAGPREPRSDRGLDPLAELEQLYRNAPLGLALLDRELRFLRVNGFLTGLSRAPEDSFLGRPLAERFPGAWAVLAPHFR